jgi:hypothetical protein
MIVREHASLSAYNHCDYSKSLTRSTDIKLRGSFFVFFSFHTYTSWRIERLCPHPYQQLFPVVLNYLFI